MSKKRLLLLGKIVLFLVAVLATLGVCADIIWPFPEARLEIFKPCPRVLDNQGQPILSLVSADEQWCFPVANSQIAPAVIDATIAVEDSRFYEHGGVDYAAILRATGQNIASMRVVSGASTLTMQVCRMMDDRPRTIASKLVESFRAGQLEELRSKDEILNLYLNYAPYGGNIRGVEAASQSYFSRHASELSIAQSAFLAGLPKSPTSYNPFRHFDKALERQKFVLLRMYETGRIDKQQYDFSLNEPIELAPSRQGAFPSHVGWYALSQQSYGGTTTIDSNIQGQLENICADYMAELPEDSEIAAVVIDISNSAIVAMVGSGNISDPVDGQVNGVIARRSPGSALKPFIYALAYESQQLSPESMVYDVPISLAGWQPSNFDRNYHGELSSAQALRRSLNIPAIWVANCLGLARCYEHLGTLGFKLPDDIEARSGLSFIVGGCEVSLLELTNAFAVFGRKGLYAPANIYSEPVALKRVYSEAVCDNINHILSSASLLPESLANSDPAQVPWFVWKTGTSSGRRDAWAVGHNGKYAIGIWVGRFYGTGRYEYVGARAAEPLLARVFCRPLFQSECVPVVPETIVVNRPLPRPKSLTETLVILSPGNGDVFAAYRDMVEISPKSNRSGKLFWYLNDLLLENIEQGLSLSAGEYQLKCVDETGETAVASFSIRAR